jgi:hypothetical protein
MGSYIKEYIGPARLIHSRQAVVCNSRQSKYPVGRDNWIPLTGRAVEYAKASGLTLLTSLGMNTWEMALAFGSHYKLDTILVVPDSFAESAVDRADILRRFHLDPEMTGFMLLDSTRSGRGKRWWQVRDHEVMSRADIILPVSIRTGGGLEKLLRQFQEKIVPDFVIPYEKESRARPRYGDHEYNPELFNGNYIVHFTRAKSSPWPNESGFDFYWKMVNSGDDYCHSAREALINILKSGVVFGGSRHIRGGHTVVGFTELSHAAIDRLFAYRAQLVNPYFEPYGIALSRETAERLGMQPVLYGPPELYDSLDETAKPYYQNPGAKDNWRHENEWRHIGDLRLSFLRNDSAAILVPDRNEARIFRDCAPCPVLTVYKDS